MTRHTVGGRLDWQALARLSRPEIQHRPELTEAARELLAAGHNIFTAAQALDLRPVELAKLLNETPTED